MLNGNYPEDEILRIKIVKTNDEKILYSQLDKNSSFLIDESSNDTITNMTRVRKRDTRNLTNLFSETYLNLELILLPNLLSLSENLRLKKIEIIYTYFKEETRFFG